MRVLGTILALFVMGASLAANGVQENRMARAKELIAEKNYNDAILILTQVVREEPDRQDEAQDLIRQIVRLRNEYNDDYERLINLLYEQKDEATALKVIAQLESLDRNPNKQTLADITQAKRTARLIANNKRYRDIMARGLAALNRQEYGQAVQVYLEGQDLAKDEFLESGFGNVFNNQIDRAWGDLKDAAAQFVGSETRLKQLATQGTSFVASSTPSSDWDAILNAMKNFVQWRQRAWTLGRYFRAQNAYLVQNGRQEDFFLGYSTLFVEGPPEAQGSQGIVGAMDQLFVRTLAAWQTQIESSVETRYQAARARYLGGEFDSARTQFDALRALSRRGLDALTLWNQFSGIDASGTMDPWFRSQLRQVLPLVLRLDQLLALSTAASQGASDALRAQTLGDGARSTRSDLVLGRQEVGSMRLNLNRWLGSARNWHETSAALVRDGWSLGTGADLGASWQTVWSAALESTTAQEAGFVDRLGQLDFGKLNDQYQTLNQTLATARSQVEGSVHFPLEASISLTSLGPSLTSLVDDVTSFVNQYEAEPQEIQTVAVRRWPAQGRDLLTRLKANIDSQVQLLATAKANYDQSQTLKQQGLALLPQVAGLVNSENFTQARAVINQASSRFSQSLTLQEDAAFRSQSDSQVKDLFAEVLKAENEVVVRDVRRLITQGSQAYLNQQFVQSEQILGRARTRWATTNVDTNAEIEYWLTLASYALSVTTGRELSPIDPLYNEVQQLLNFARRSFSMGSEALKAGKKEDGLLAMQQAKDTLSKILLPFPQNQEARLLNLQILQASDPENFPARFKESFDSAVARINSEPTNAYNDLLDLSKLEPDYPGMVTAIKSVRLKLRLDRPPVDTTALQQAKTLVAQASRLVAAGSQTQLIQAQTLLRQALQRDPNNTTAQELSDTVSLRLAPTVGTKTPTILGELNEIQDLLRSQRTLEALSRMNEFKAKYPNLVNDAQVKELDRRIRAVN